jgi:hypothetical protein
MDSFTIKYRNQILELKKSKKFIAVKPRIGAEKKVLADILPNASQDSNAVSTIGGFQLINVEDDKNPLENTLNMLRANPAISAGTHAYETSNDEVPFVPTGQLVIEYAEDASVDDCMELLDKHKLAIVEVRDNNELIVQITTGSENPVKTAYSLQQSPLINIAEPEFVTPGKLTLNLPTTGLLRYKLIFLPSLN